MYKSSFSVHIVFIEVPFPPSMVAVVRLFPQGRKAEVVLVQTQAEQFRALLFLTEPGDTSRHTVIRRERLRSRSALTVQGVHEYL